MTELQLAAKLRQHVKERGGPTRNSAWQMMLDAADAIDELALLRCVYRAATAWRDAPSPLAMSTAIAALLSTTEAVENFKANQRGHNEDERVGCGDREPAAGDTTG